MGEAAVVVGYDKPKYFLSVSNTRREGSCKCHFANFISSLHAATVRSVKRLVQYDLQLVNNSFKNIYFLYFNLKEVKPSLGGLKLCYPGLI